MQEIDNDLSLVIPVSVISTIQQKLYHKMNVINFSKPVKCKYLGMALSCMRKLKGDWFWGMYARAVTVSIADNRVTLLQFWRESLTSGVCILC